MRFALFFLYLTSVLSYQEHNIKTKTNDPDNNQTIYPTSVLIDESSETFWKNYKLDRTGWTATANSEQTTNSGNEGPISNIFDGNPSTIWHSRYNTGGAGGHDERTKNGPFQITIDLKKTRTFRAFSVMPRTTGQPNGRFRLYEFYVADSSEELESKILNSNYVAKGNIDHTSPKSTLVILPISVKGRFVALRSLNHDTFGTCAEFNLYRDPYSPSPTPMQYFIDESKDKFWKDYKLDRTGWTATANSEHTTNSGNEGPISNILDGNSATLWHSKYGGGGTGWHDERPSSSDPFQFTIDLGSEKYFKAFSYMPRTSGDPNGRFRHYEFYVANTMNELNNKVQNNEYVAKGDIDHTIALSTMVIFNEPEKGRYIQLRSLNHDSYATCAEFNLYSDPPTLPGFYSLELIDESAQNSWSNYKINRNGWSATANSEQTTNSGNEGPISNILDGNAATLWHSRYNTGGAGGHDERPSSSDPFQFTVDLGKETTFKAFAYRPRSNGPNGKFKHFEFYTAKTTEELNTKINNSQYLAKGMFDKNAVLSSLVALDSPETARYVALLSLNHDTYGTCAEFNLYSDPSVSVEIPTPTPIPTPISTLSLIDESTDSFWSPNKMDREGWVVAANSEQRKSGNEGPITNIVDGNPSTMWHSSYNNNENGHEDRPRNTDPFMFTIDLGSEKIFKAFAYMPRSGNNGRIGQYEFYSALTSEELYAKIRDKHCISKGSFDRGSDRSSLVMFNDPVNARFIALLSLNHDTYGTCAEFNLYACPPSTPTLSPTASPSQSMTPTPAIPGNPPDVIVVDPEDTENGRLEVDQQFQQYVYVQVKVTNFTKINHTDDGGAIHVVNAGIKCEKTVFQDCTSEKSGGAVYINNNYNMDNNITFNNINFANNQAQIGGAIYIYASSYRTIVSINNCNFVNNVATLPVVAGTKSGGSAIFLTARNGNLNNNKYSNHQDSSSVVRIYNKYDQETKLLDLDTFKISNCIFERNSNSKSCLYYTGASNGASFELINCKFNDVLSPGSHYIDGISLSKNSPKLIVRKCKFASDLKNSLNMNNDYLSIDINDQVFDFIAIDEKKKPVNTVLIVVAVAVSTIAIAAVASAIIIVAIKKRNKNKINTNEHEMNTTKHDLLMDENLL